MGEGGGGHGEVEEGGMKRAAGDNRPVDPVFHLQLRDNRSFLCIVTSSDLTHLPASDLCLIFALIFFYSHLQRGFSKDGIWPHLCICFVCGCLRVCIDGFLQ